MFFPGSLKRGHPHDLLDHPVGFLFINTIGLTDSQFGLQNTGLD
jgi:hypothetical protein